MSQVAEAASSSKPSPPFKYGNPSPDYAGVVATGPNGDTNPDKPKMNTPINQTSDSRLATINSMDDWCTFGPLDEDTQLADQEERTVAWCTKPRNNARVIPDGTLTAVHFVKTDLYVQVMALGDFTKIGIKPGDTGGELDPHGQYGKGNPVGGNVTSNVSGKDVFYQEWMNYVGHNIMCFRVCIAGSDEATPEKECEHTLDEMGCNWVMPGDYSPDVFDSCEADPAYPPGIYVENGSTSSFQQYMTGLWTDNGKERTFTNGKKGQKTPSVAQSLPKSSKCTQGKSPANGIASLSKSAESMRAKVESDKPDSGSQDGGAGGSGSKRDSNGSNGGGNNSNSGSGSGSGSNQGKDAAVGVAAPLFSVVAMVAATFAGFFVI